MEIPAGRVPPGRVIPGREAREEQINLSQPGTYRVRPGDTMAKIARRFGTTSAILMGLNTTRIEHPTVLDTGSVIRVPEKPGSGKKSVKNGAASVARRKKEPRGEKRERGGPGINPIEPTVSGAATRCSKSRAATRPAPSC